MKALQQEKQEALQLEQRKVAELTNELASAKSACDNLSREKADIQSELTSTQVALQKAQVALEQEKSTVTSVSSQNYQLKGKWQNLEKCGLSGSVDRLLKEEAFQSQDPRVHYDVILSVKSLEEINRGGWAILHKDDESYETFEKRVVGFSVGILGNYNAGKTFFLTHLTHKRGVLPCGFRIHTQGMSLKLLNLQDEGSQESGKQTGTFAFFIDTQGLNTSVLQEGKLSELESSPEAKSGNGAEKVAAPEGRWSLHRSTIKDLDREEDLELSKMKATEDFQRQVVLDSSDVFFFVVGYLSRQDMMDMKRLYRSVTELKGWKSRNLRLCVIHNVKEFTYKQFQEEKYVERLQQHYKGRLEIQHVKPGFSFLYGEIGAAGSELSVQHFFLTNNDASDNMNHLVFDYLKEMLRTFHVKDFSMRERLLDTMTKYLPSYIQIPDVVPQALPKLEIRQPEGEGVRKICWDPVQKQIEVKCQGLGSYVTHASDGLRFSLSKTVCFVKTYEEERVARLMVVLGIEMPGLDVETFKEMRRCIRPVSKLGAAKPHPMPTTNLSCTKLDGEEKGVRVELKATLQSVPSGVCEAMSELQEEELLKERIGLDKKKDPNETRSLQPTFGSSSLGLVQTRSSIKCRVQNQGTRAILEHRHHRAVHWCHIFTKEELLDWDWNYPPFAVYQHGILGLGFVTSQEISPEGIADYEDMPQEDVDDSIPVDAQALVAAACAAAADKGTLPQEEMPPSDKHDASPRASQSTWEILPENATRL